MTDRQVENRKPSALKPFPRNVRTHPGAEIQRIGESIDQFGFTSPVLIDETDTILAGHARVLAAKARRLPTIPVIVLRGLSDAQKRAYVLLDNKIAEMSGYDRGALALELKDLSKLLEKDGLDLSLTGFDSAEVDALLTAFVDAEHGAADEVPPLPELAVSLPGDIWNMGRHRLFCGDARHSAYDRLMGSTRAAMVFTDPPYNVSIPKTVGRGRNKHRNFAMAAGEMSQPEYTDFLAESLGPAAQQSRPGALQYVCMDWRHYGELLEASKRIYGELLNVVVWAKTNGGQGSFYRSQHEEIFVFRAGSAPHQNHVQLGRYGRNRSNLWTYPGANTFRSGRSADLASHPTVKPVGLVADAMRDCTRRGEAVLDPFLGAGTTILAAEQTGRCGYGVEIDPRYVDCAVRRWQSVTKTDAVLLGTRTTFDQVAAKRLAYLGTRR